ncbi:hypothetical protein SAMN04487846_3517 [Microbacterium sp. cf046]|uniref:DUF2332 domain-containing protein n=1 Tax=Microbacterium sp. cf046 TaxID=1761803 RepID=UPI0008F3D270|nr:DUF2332 domain-containing protein [Microbacterium sp. cf046]SFS17327.1 hypothetical protein SAMN04487846_3517 [Microbacterium sp. cf046]
MDAAADVSERYGRFAREEAPGRSALYAQWAAGVESDAEISALLGRIPATHRQPPLVFAVTRMLGAPERSYSEWAAWVLAHADRVVDECSRRSLQTNEPLRCAALLPALSDIAGPLALLEIGASAGLCLYPDRYSYRYGGGPDLDPVDGVSAVVLHADVSGDPPLRMPEIVWRAGIDLHPLEVADLDDRRVLLSLVWPGERGRAARIDAALDIAAADPPLLVRGDATEEGVLERLAARAPADATLVITTPGVLPHIARAGRERLFRILAGMDAVWVSIDPPGLHDEWDPPVDSASWGGFVLGRDRVPLAAVDPLGAFVEWRAGGARERR